jgi:hypothetical protein
MNRLTFNEFQSLCKEAWKAEGNGSNKVILVHNCLLRCYKNTGMGLKQVISSAWKCYKETITTK